MIYIRGFLFGKKVLLFDYRVVIVELDFEYGFGEGIIVLGGELVFVVFS